MDSSVNVPRVFQYMTVATISLVSYEYLIKLDKEIRYLWGRRFSFGGALLAMCRYLPFSNTLQIYVLFSTTDMDPTPCLNGYRATACFIYVEFLLSILVLFTRTYAVWGRSRYIFVLLAFIYIGAVAGSSYSMSLFLRGLGAPPIHTLNHCLLVLTNDDVWITLVILVLCESLALVLLLVKSVQHARAMKNFGTMQLGGSTRSIMTVMAKDGIGYFACTLVITTANLIIIWRVTTDLRDLLFVTQGALQGILCGRLLFHIHDVNEFPNDTDALEKYSSDWRVQSDQEIEMSPRGGRKRIDAFAPDWEY